LGGFGGYLSVYFTPTIIKFVIPGNIYALRSAPWALQNNQSFCHSPPYNIVKSHDISKKIRANKPSEKHHSTSVIRVIFRIFIHDHSPRVIVYKCRNGIVFKQFITPKTLFYANLETHHRAKLSAPRICRLLPNLTLANLAPVIHCTP